MYFSQRVMAGILGATAGVFAWTAAVLVSRFPQFFVGISLIGLFAYKGMVIGSVLGFFLCCKNFFIHPNPVLSGQRWLFACGWGAFAGLAAFTIGQTFFLLHAPIVLVRMVSWTALGLFLGVLSGVRAIKPVHLLYYASVGTIAGFLGGFAFELFQHSTYSMDHYLGVIVVSILLFMGIYLAESVLFRSYLQVLVGPCEGNHYLINKVFSIGYSSKNEVALPGYSEISAVHAYIMRDEKNVPHIISQHASDQVLVNYRLVDQQSLSNGDIIKIGDALLHYYEK